MSSDKTGVNSSELNSLGSESIVVHPYCSVPGCYKTAAQHPLKSNKCICPEHGEVDMLKNVFAETPEKVDESPSPEVVRKEEAGSAWTDGSTVCDQSDHPEAPRTLIP